jgi:hypothetical protein
MNARFRAESRIRCATCGLGVQFAIASEAVEKDYALEAIDAARSETRRWLIDHAKTCKGRETILPTGEILRGADGEPYGNADHPMRPQDRRASTTEDPTT